MNRLCSLAVALAAAGLCTGTAAAVPIPAAPAAGCDAGAMAADLGQRLQVLRCYPGWAYVSTGEAGDATSLLRVVNGTWVRYTGFPSALCRTKAAADGVPPAELNSFSTNSC